MKISEIAVRRPVATTMVFVALTVVGSFSYSRLRVDLFPELDFPSISVTTSYSGVGPEEVETLLTRPIEAAVARVEGADRIESFSTEGRSRVSLRFDWGYELEEAMNDTRAAVERARAQLPDDAGAPVVYKFDLTNLPVLTLALSGQMDEAQMRRFGEDIVAPYFERTPGVAAVDIRGAREREIRIELDAGRMNALNVSPTQVSNAIRNQSLTVPAGVVAEGSENVLVRAMGEFESIDDIMQAVVATRGGEPIRVADIGVVIDDFEDRVNVVRINGEDGIRISVNKSPDANTIEVADLLYETVERFNRDYGDVANCRIISDSSVFIRRSISGVQQSVLVGAALALIVLLVFLQSIRSTLVIGVAIPISVIATFLLMMQLDLTLNLITFGGLALGIGMLVDNSIVILENIYRHRENEASADVAAIKGSAEVGGAIVASTMTTLAVFLPVIFIGGFAAVFFGQMALVVTSALLCSLFVALTLVPVLASVFLRGRGTSTNNPARKALDLLDRAYSRTVSGALRFSPIVLLIAVGGLVAVMGMRDQVGSELLPESDESEIRVFGQYPAGTRIELTEQAAIRVEELVREHVPEATDIYTTVGNRGNWSSSGEESFSMGINIVPVEERDRSSEEIANALRPVFMREIPGMRVFARAGGGLWIFRFIRGGDERLRIEIRGHELATADALAAEVVRTVQEVEGVTDARASREEGGRELQLYVNRERADDYGMTTRDVAEVISLFVQGRDAGVYREGGDEFRLRVRLPESDLASLQTVLSTPVTLPSGGTVELRELVHVRDGQTPPR